MSKKTYINHPGIVIPLITIGCALMCFSVGFSSWFTSSAVSQSIYGNVDADNFSIDSGEEVPCFRDLSLSELYCNSTDGFVQADGSFGYTATITGKVYLIVSNAKTVVASLDSSSQLIVRISLAVINYDWTADTAVSVSTTITSSTPTSSPSGSQIKSSAGLISNDFLVSNINLQSDSILIAFTSTITASSTSYSTFYTSVQSGISFVISAKEA